MSMIALDEHIVDLLYEGIADRACVEQAIELCLDRLNASGGNIQVTSKTEFRPPYFIGVGDGYNEANITEYLDHWQYANAHRDAMRQAYQDNPGIVFLCHEHISEEDFATGAYFQNFFHRVGQRWLAGGLAHDSAGTEISISFSRRTDQKQFGAAEADFIAALMPHVRRAMRLAARLTQSFPAGPAPLSHGLMAARTATFLIDGMQKVHWHNNAALDLVTNNTGVLMIDQTLRLQDGHTNAKLGQAIRAMLDKRLAQTPSYVITAQSNDQSLELEMAPATLPKGSRAGPASLVLVMVRKIGLSPDVSDRLRREYGLTHAESALALLMAEGISIDEAAARKQLSPHTVRTHLRSIFSKTGVTKQTALTALVWRSA